jgi:hypothetical protein
MDFGHRTLFLPLGVYDILQGYRDGNSFQMFFLACHSPAILISGHPTREMSQ